MLSLECPYCEKDVYVDPYTDKGLSVDVVCQFCGKHSSLEAEELEIGNDFQWFYSLVKEAQK